MIRKFILSVLPRKETRPAHQPVKMVFGGNITVRVVEQRDVVGLPSYSLTLERYDIVTGKTEAVGLIHLNRELLTQLDLVREAGDWCSKRLAMA
jgi:hypothetical protein